MGVCMSANEEGERREAEELEKRKLEDSENTKKEKSKVEDDTRTFLKASQSLPGANYTHLTLKETEPSADDTRLVSKEAAPSEEKNPNAIDDLEASGKGNNFWELFWAVVYVLANPKTTWAFLPDRVKKPLIVLAKTFDGAVDKLVVDPTKWIVNKLVVDPLTRVVDTVVLKPATLAVDYLVAKPIDFVVEKVSEAAGFLKGKVVEKVVDPIVAKGDDISGAIKEKVDSAKEGAGAALSSAASKVGELFSKHSANSPPEPGDNNLLPMKNSMDVQRGSEPTPIDKPPQLGSGANPPKARL